MARINTNVASLTAQRGLSRSQRTMDDTLNRLSSGLRITRGADDPAGLIASEALRSEMNGIAQAIDNSSRATNVIATAEGALSEVAALLVNIKELVVQAANSGALSAEEIAANQLQVDSAVESITRISNTTTFAGRALINGTLDYLTSGVSTNDIKSLSISQANFGTNATIPVEIDVLSAALPGQLEFRSSAIAGDVTLEISGNEGIEVLSFQDGTSCSAIAFAINRISDATGVSAEMRHALDVTSGITLSSAGYGSKNFVSVKAQDGAFATQNIAGSAKSRQEGHDTIATVNGALTVGDGLNVKLNTASLDLDVTLSETLGANTTDFTITGGGALFQLGARVSSNQQVNIGIGSVAASKLGDENVGFLSDVVTGGTATLVGGDAAAASKILETAIRQVAVTRGRLGAFEKNTLQTTMNSLAVTLENVTASESKIRDADFAKETSELTRAQILTQAGTSVLATANSTPQSVLSLLQG